MPVKMYQIAVAFDVDGSPVDVGALRIRLAPNAIPTVLLTVSPRKTVKAAEVYSATAESILATLSNASAKVGKLCSLKITMTPAAENGEIPVTVELSGWTLTGVGLAELSASGQLAMQLEIQHPAYTLDRALPGAAFDFRDMEQMIEGQDAGNLLAAYIEALKAWSLRIKGLSGLTDTQKNLANRIDLVVKNLPLKLHWGNVGSAFPLQGTGYSSAAAHTKFVYQNLVNSNGLGSVWEHMARLLTDEYQICIAPTYMKPWLSLIPFSPWGKPEILISADRMANIVMPPCEISPIAGMRIVYSKVQQLKTETDFNAVTQDDAAMLTSDKVAQSDSSAAPEIVDKITLTPLATTGLILPVQCPAWLTPAATQTVLKDEASWKGYAEDDAGEENNSKEIASRANGLLDAASDTLATAELLNHYRQNREVNFNTGFMPIVAGVQVVPGYRVNVTGESNKPVFSFFLTGIEHCIDVQSGSAYTSWVGSYVRMATDPACDSVLSYPQANPLYTT